MAVAAFANAIAPASPQPIVKPPPPSPLRRSAYRKRSGKTKLANEGYFTIEAEDLIAALDSVVGLSGRVLEPAAGRGHMAGALRDSGLQVVASELNVYPDPLITDIVQRDLRAIDNLNGFAWTIANLPYSPGPYHDEPALHLVTLAAAARCGVALLTRNDASTAASRQHLLHGHPNSVGKIEMWRPR